MGQPVFDVFYDAVIEAVDRAKQKAAAKHKRPASSKPAPAPSAPPDEGQTPEASSDPCASETAASKSSDDEVQSPAVPNDHAQPDSNTPPKSETAEPPPQGKLILHATVAPQAIRFPTDLSLLNEAREFSERIIDELYAKTTLKKKPRTYRQKARKAYLGIVKKMTSDLPYAKRVAEYLGVDLHTVHVGPEMADDLPEMLYQLDEPLADPAPLNVFYISKLAREHDIKVLLSGAGGDDIFTGYRRHLALANECYWAWLPKPARVAIAGLARALPAKPVALRRLRKGFRYADLDEDVRLVSYFNWLESEQCEVMLAPNVPKSTRPNPLLESLDDIPKNATPLDRLLYLECRHFLADHNLAYTDKMSMAVGVEVRVPLLDRDLVDLAFQLPAKFKQRGFEGKWIFKKAMEGILPRELIY